MPTCVGASANRRATVSDQREHVLPGRAIRVRFFWLADRYAHAVEVARGGAWIEICGSIEGSADERWPASPALQSLHEDARADGRRVALLVGMAGKSHWSASIELDDSANALEFDVACRLATAEGAALGSSYRCDQLSSIVEPGRARWTIDEAPPIVLEVADSEEPGQASLKLDGQRLSIVPRTVLTAGAQTVRWRYRVRIDRR